MLLVVALLVAVAVGSIGRFSGAGWFSYRTWWFDDGDLYTLNLGDKPLWVSVDGADKRLVEAENAAVIRLLGGTSTVAVFDDEAAAPDAAIATYTVTIDGSHALLKLTDEGCLAVVNITPFYAGGADEGQLDFVAQLTPETRLWIADSRNVVWPRRDFPPKLLGGEGRGLWVEIVGCALFDEVKFLDAYLVMRLEARLAKERGEADAY